MALTPQPTLRNRILVVLSSRDGGTGTRAEVLADLETAFKSQWTAEDLQSPDSRPLETKWRNRASFEQADMVRDGLLSDRADGVWMLTPTGRQAAAAFVGSVLAVRDAERKRRDGMWRMLLAVGGPANVPAGIVNKLRIFRGGRGVYADGENTRGALGTDGVTVSFLHNGVSYADELSADGVRYHYPKTDVPGRDDAEVSASRAAYKWGLPVFVVTTGTPESLRTVHRGYIEEYDDTLGIFLVTFTNGTMPPPPPGDEPNAPFSLTEGADAAEIWSKRRGRPNQQRFAFQVIKRYGGACATCGLAIPALLHAAHLRAKKESGSDDPKNGFPLCPNHHIAFDASLWTIEPTTTTLVTKSSGPTLQELAITRTDLSHLSKLPHQDALNHVWKRWNGPAATNSQ